MTDTRIVELSRSGRPAEALALVLQAYRRKVFALAFSFLRDRDAAEDVTQEVFVKLWRALPRYDGRASLSTWIYTITRNASVSALRARRNVSSLDDPQVLQAVEESTADVSEDAGADRASLLRLVESLPERQRQVVILFYMDERSHEEVSEMLAMPVGTVKTLLHRARARLAELVGAVQSSEAI